MASFSRKVDRQKKTFAITKKTKEVKRKRSSMIKDVLTFTWMPWKKKSLLLIIGTFLLVTWLIVPLLLMVTSMEVATVLAMGLILPAMLVGLLHYFIDTEPVTKKELSIRYMVLSVLMIAFSLITLIFFN